MDATFLIILVLAVGGLWLMSSRQRKTQAAANEFRNNLVAGDEVMTGSGLFGTVVDVEGDVVTLESTPGQQTRWLRAAIAKKIEPPVEADEIEAGSTAVDPAIAEAERIQRANDEVIDVPDDLSSLPPRKDDDEDGKN
ncbi:preprotein translocase subunit YajC [Cellulomonas alba]|uniref:Preprotein translocase subunit YajC n=1 Tax=Cellulomonas alba TaxID=3053467 RepID=A0ABT7SB86_9CELL|nr:preprotein translocase subunit YajC [Cellulomonas alba]MDM7853440.1 preprotein translocase subunit YajC [Cellulomonas alba]